MMEKTDDLEQIGLKLSNMLIERREELEKYREEVEERIRKRVQAMDDDNVTIKELIGQIQLLHKDMSWNIRLEREINKIDTLIERAGLTLEELEGGFILENTRGDN